MRQSYPPPDAHPEFQSHRDIIIIVITIVIVVIIIIIIIVAFYCIQYDSHAIFTVYIIYTYINQLLKEQKMKPVQIT